MKVSVTQTGGPLGVPYRSELDAAALSEEDAATLRRHAQAVTPATASARAYPGELAYAVCVEPDAGDPVEAGYTDGSMPDDVRTLVRWVEEHPRSTRGVRR